MHDDGYKDKAADGHPASHASTERAYKRFHPIWRHWPLRLLVLHRHCALHLDHRLGPRYWRSLFFRFLNCSGRSLTGRGIIAATLIVVACLIVIIAPLAAIVFSFADATQGS